MEKIFRGQRLGNVGLNVDENIRNREEKRRMGLKAFGRPRARCGCSFFYKIRPKKRNKKMKRLVGPDLFKRGKNNEAPEATILRM